MNTHLSATARRQWLRLSTTLAAAAFASIFHQTSWAQAWPTQPVKIVLAVAAGSSGDTLARLIAPRLEEIWKQPVIVENRPGAGGILGTETVVAAKDGHTMLLASQSSFLPKYTQKSLRFDPATDLVPIAKLIEYESVLVTNAQSQKKAKSFAEVVALSKADAKGLFFSGTGPTSIFNISMAILNQFAGINYTGVNFNNVGAMNMALLRDDAQLMINTPSSIKAHVDSGALVPLAAISKQRYANLPNVPTIFEVTNYRGYLPVLWAGMVMPKGTPAAVVDRVARDLQTVVLQEETRKKIETTLSGTVQRSSPDQFAKQISEEMDAWKRLDIKPE